MGRVSDCVGVRCDPLRGSVCGVGDQRGVSGVCDAGGVDGAEGDGEACRAEGMVTAVTDHGGSDSERQDGDCVSRSGVIRAGVIAADRAVRVASAAAGECARVLSGGGREGLLTAVGVREGEGRGLGGARDGLQESGAAVGVHVIGVLASGHAGSLAGADRFAAWRLRRHAGMGCGSGWSRGSRSRNGRDGKGTKPGGAIPVGRSGSGWRFRWRHWGA